MKHPLELMIDFYRRTGREISSRTVRNYRWSLGFHPVHARTQPLLKQDHAQQRLLFSNRYIDGDYSKIIFADEKAFVVDSSGIVHWIPYGRPRPTEFTNPIKFRIAVFGAVWYNNKSDLVFIQNRTNTTTFVEFLQAAFHSHRRSIKNYSFTHDHPRWAHTSLAHAKHRYVTSSQFDREFQALQTHLILIQQILLSRNANLRNIREIRENKGGTSD